MSLRKREHAVESLIFLEGLRRKGSTGRRDRRNWTVEENRYLESLVGKLLPRAIARQFKRPYNQVMCRLHRLGYNYYTDLIAPLGGTVTMVAREVGIPKDSLWDLVGRGLIVPSGREGKKDFFIPRAEIARFKKVYAKWERMRLRIIHKMTGPTVSKLEAARRLNISETHIERYMQGKVIVAWKVPNRWSINAPKQLWEWRALESDVERVRVLRAAGKLPQYTRAYRKQITKQSERIAQLRKARRLGQSGIEHTRSCPKPGYLSPSQVALSCRSQWYGAGRKVSEQQVYTAIWNHRLPAEKVRVGLRNFWAIKASDLPQYQAWFARGKRYTGPLVAHRSEIARIHALGLITISEAVTIFRTMRWCVSSAVQRGDIPRRAREGEVIGLKRQEVATYFRNQRIKQQRRAAVKARGRKRAPWTAERRARQMQSVRGGSGAKWGARGQQPWAPPGRVEG